MATTQSSPNTELLEASLPSRSLQLHRFRAYLFWLLLIPSVVYASVFPLVMIPALNYERWGPSKWGPILQYGFDLNHQDADVVIFGDSSAFLGIDPRTANAQLGVKSLVIPNTIGSLPITGETALQKYLANNRPPRLIVLYFSAWNLNYEQTARARYLFEGEEMLLHNGSRADVARFALEHPLELLAFPLRLNSTLGLQLLKTVLRGDRERQTAAALGHVDYTDPISPLTPACELPEKYLAMRDDASIERLVRRYTTPQTEVAVYLAPVPGCKNASAVTGRSYAALGAAPPVPLEASSFADDLNYAHIQAASVGSATQLFIKSMGPKIKAATSR